MTCQRFRRASAYILLYRDALEALPYLATLPPLRRRYRIETGAPDGEYEAALGIEAHAKGQAEIAENFFNFVESRTAKVLVRSISASLFCTRSPIV